MKIVQLFLFTSLLLLPISTAAASDAFLLSEEGFELRFPYAYEELAPAKDDDTEKRNFVAGNQEDGVSFVFMYGEVDSKDLPPEKVLAILTEPTAPQDPQASITPLPSKDYIGAETIRPLAQEMGPDGVFQWYRKRALIQGSTLYQLELFANTREELTSPRSNAFFDSFTLRKGNANDAGKQASTTTGKP